MSNKTPKIRFAGFNDNWEVRKLGEVGEIVTGSTPPTQYQEYYSENGILWVTPTDITDNLISNTQKKLSPLGEKVGRVVPANTILVTCIASIGKNTMLTSKGSFNQQINGLIPKEQKFNPYFLLTESYFWSAKMKREAAAATMQIVNKNDFSEIETFIPTPAEQQRIGEYFSRLDDLIGLYKRKLEKSLNLKKAMLEKMFPQNGKPTPQIRFAGFNDNWEVRKLPEFVNFFNGLTYSPNDIREYGTLVLRSSNVKDGEIVDADNVYVDTEKATSEKVQKGDIIVVVRNGSRALIGKHAEIKMDKPNTVIGAFMTGIRSNNYSFVNALLNTSQFENEIEKNMGATINQITGYMFEKMIFIIPQSHAEQQRIGEYFSRLDDLIGLYKRKLEKSLNLKKAMLEKMFP